MGVKTAPKTKTTAILKWEEKYAAAAREAAAITGTATGNFIGTAGGILKVDKVAVPGNVLECIVLAHIFENAMYDQDYDPDNPVPPICFAFGTKEADMVPHKDAAKPQHANCKDCPRNVFGTAEKGRGKACKNMRRLGLAASDIIDGGAERVENAKVHYLKFPPTSLASFDGFVNKMSDTLHRPPYALISNIKGVPSPEGRGFTLEISLKGRIEDLPGVKDATHEALEAKHMAVAKEIDFPYRPLTLDDKAAKKLPKKGAATKPGKFTRAGKR